MVNTSNDLHSMFTASFFSLCCYKVNCTEQNQMGSLSSEIEISCTDHSDIYMMSHASCIVATLSLPVHVRLCLGVCGKHAVWIICIMISSCMCHVEIKWCEASAYLPKYTKRMQLFWVLLACGRLIQEALRKKLSKVRLSKVWLLILM